MSYIIGQYNHSMDSGDDSEYINLITSGVPKRYQVQGASGAGLSVSLFEDECIQVNELSSAKYYYFKCQIKRLSSMQVFTVKLINYNSTEGQEQYIKTITIQGGSLDEWVNVEFIFHPLNNFDTILFSLQRNLDDYGGNLRYPKIAYQELGIINNIINSKVKNGVSLAKLGIQSSSNLVMCINGEEIHTPRSGIFEIKNGIISIDFFSVVNAAKELGTELDTWLQNIGFTCKSIEEQVAEGAITRERANTMLKNIQSKSFLNTSKKIEINSFVLDYMYEN